MTEIRMDYIGGILSENEYKFLTKRTKPMVRMWMSQLSEKVKQAEIPESKYYTIGVFGRFYDERRPDISNLFKVISDAIQKGLGVDDKWFRMEDRGYELGVFEQELVITIEGEKSES